MPVCNHTPEPLPPQPTTAGECLHRFLTDDAANTQVEYLFMLMLVIFVAIAGVTKIGGTTKTLFDATKNAMP